VWAFLKAKKLFISQILFEYQIFVTMVVLENFECTYQKYLISILMEILIMIKECRALVATSYFSMLLQHWHAFLKN